MGSTPAKSSRVFSRLLVVLALFAAVLVAPTATPAAEATGGGWIDTSNRNAVVSAYNAEFGAAAAPIGWTGNRATCSPGTTSQAFRNDVIGRVNFFRQMAGVPGGVTEDPSLSAAAQEMALMIGVTNDTNTNRSPRWPTVLSHNPQPRQSSGSQNGYDCFTTTGQTAAGKSNLYLGRYGVDSIDGYMLDPGAGNAAVGHRNWILHPTLRQIGTGDVPSPGWSSNALYVITGDTFAPQPAMRESTGMVAWPPRGFVPGDLVYPRWSLGLRGANFDSSNVSVTRNGQAVSTSVEFRNSTTNGAPFSILVWNVNGVDTAPAADTTYTVTVTNVAVAGTSQTISYDVTILGDTPAPTPTTPTDPPASAAEMQNFVVQAYQDFLGRQPSASELSTWTGRLTSGSSSSFDFVRALADSPEWTAYVVDQMYLDTLGRRPDAGGRNFWIGRLQSGTTVAAAAASFYGSPEYIENEGGTYDAWIRDLYAELLLRTPESTGLSFWVSQANQRGPGNVAFDFYQSQESRETRVNLLYETFLNRGPDSSGLAYWAGQLNNGDDLALAAFLASSPEYFALAQK